MTFVTVKSWPSTSALQLIENLEHIQNWAFQMQKIKRKKEFFIFYLSKYLIFVPE